jgi:hypothetical protein
MSDGKVSLDFLGEQMLRMQADLRGVRSEQVKLESEQANMQAEMAGMRVDVASIDTKVDRVETKLDNFAASVDARFDQVNRTMATNLDVVIKALEANKR